MIKSFGSYLKVLTTEIVGIVTSRQRLKDLLRISLYRNAFYLILSNVAVPLTGFLFWIIVARVYDPKEVGIASAAIAAMTFLATLSTLGFEFAMVRFLPNSASGANRIINSSLTVAGICSIVSCGVFIVGINIWSPALLFLQDDLGYLVAFVVLTLTYTISMIVVNVFVARRRSVFSLSHSLILSVLRLPLPIILASFFKSFGIFASWGISWIVALMTSLLFFLPRVQNGYRPIPTIDRNAINEIAHFSLANYLANLLWVAPGLILPVLVLNLLGAEINAYFYITWTVASVLATISMSTSLSLFAEGSTDEKSLDTNILRSVKLTFLIIIPAVMLMMILADKLLLLFGAEYSGEGTALLRILTLAALPIGINHIYIGVKRVQNRLAVIVGIGVVIVIITLVGSSLLVPLIGVTGVGIAWLGSQSIVALWVIVRFLLRKRI